MRATDREINAAIIGAGNDQHWQRVCDKLLADNESYMDLWRQYNRLCDTTMGAGAFAQFFGQLFPLAAVLLDVAMLRIQEEAVRRGVLPEQDMSRLPPMGSFGEADDLTEADLG